MSKENKQVKPLETEINLSYKTESAVNNANIESATVTEDFSGKSVSLEMPSTNNNIYYNEEGQLVTQISTTEIFNKTYNLSDYYNGELSPAMDLVQLQQFYHDNGCSTEKTYEYLKNYILDNKDNPEVLNSAISNILKNLNEFYDHDTPHTGVAETNWKYLIKYSMHLAVLRLME